jgi:hypothetical protein
MINLVENIAANKRDLERQETTMLKEASNNIFLRFKGRDLRAVRAERGIT